MPADVQMVNNDRALPAVLLGRILKRDRSVRGASVKAVLQGLEQCGAQSPNPWK